MLINADDDRLRNGGYMMEDALSKVRAPLAHRIYNGVTHELCAIAAVVEKVREAQAGACERLLEAFAGA